jgi:hypothetical protein
MFPTTRYFEEGGIVGIDIDQASTRLDLGSLETSELPLRDLKAA